MILLLLYLGTARYSTKRIRVPIFDQDMESIKELFNNFFILDDELICQNKRIKEGKVFGLDSYMVILFSAVVFIDLIVLMKGYNFIIIPINNVITPALIIFTIKKDETNKQIERLKEIHIELPIILQQYYCMISINHTTEEALSIILPGIHDPYLKREFNILYDSLDSGFDLHEALSSCFCDGKSIYLSRLKGTMLSFYYYGNDETRESFLNLVNDLMQNRVNLLKEKGEKIKVKMVFPIILIFVASMISLGAPMIIGLNL